MAWKPSSRGGARGAIKRDSHVDVRYHPGIEGVDEILRPTLLCFGEGSCFRLLKETWPWGEEEFGGKEDNAQDREARRPIDDTYDEGDDPLSELSGAVQLPNGLYSLSLPMPSEFFKFIIGSQGATRKNIEEDTKCRLSIPKRGVENGNVVITGETVSAVAHAKRRVEMVAWTNRFKTEPTHFLSIPLNLPNLMHNVNTFKEQALQSCAESAGLVEEAFQSPEKLHLTLGVLRIFSKEEEAKAIEILHRVVSGAKVKLGSEPVSISLQGLDCMSDDVTAATVIYAKVSSCKRLQPFVDEVSNSFIREGPELMQREFEREGVKLHATVINSRFLERAKGELQVYRGRRREIGSVSINATQLFKLFGDYEFGEVKLTSIHLSKRKDKDPNGYYKCVSKCPIST